MVQYFVTFLLYAVLAVFAQNAIFTRALGVSRLLRLVHDTTDTLLFGALLTAVQLVAAPLGWAAMTWLTPILGDYRMALRPLIYLLCASAAYGLVWAVTTYLLPLNNRKEIGETLPLATFNSCVLGTLLISANQSYTLPQAFGFALGSSVGYLLAVLLVTEAQRKLQSRSIPASFKGLPINLVYIGILALAIYGFTGHSLSV